MYRYIDAKFTNLLLSHYPSKKSLKFSRAVETKGRERRAMAASLAAIFVGCVSSLPQCNFRRRMTQGAR